MLQFGNRKPSTSQLVEEEVLISDSNLTKDSGLEPAIDSRTETIDDTSSEDATQITSQDLQRMREDVWEPVPAGLREYASSLWQDEIFLASQEAREKVDSGVQTDLLFPTETTNKSCNVERQVELLKGMLKAKNWAIEQKHGMKKKQKLSENAIENTATSPFNAALSSNTKRNIGETEINVIILDDDEDDRENNEVIQPDYMTFLKPKTTLSSQTINNAVCEVLRYSLRKPPTEEPIAAAFGATLNYMKIEIVRDVRYVIENWVGSLMESATDIMLQTVDIEGSMSCQLIVDFCINLLDTLIISDHFEQGNIQECYATIILHMSRSPAVAIKVADNLITKIGQTVKLIGDENAQTLIGNGYILDASYYLINMLIMLLSGISNHQKKGFSKEDLQCYTKNEKSNTGVLNLWRRHWTPAQKKEKNNTDTPTSSIFQNWHQSLENSLQKAFLSAPLLSPLLMTCLDILKGKLSDLP